MTDSEQADGGLLLRAESLRLKRGRTEVVRDADLTVSAGEVVAIIGPNGAGKSTLLAGLAGAIRPKRGRVTAHGRVALAQQTGALADRSARANIEVALSWWGVPKARRRPRAMAALESVGATGLAERRVGALSGGEQRRIHLARAMALHADVLMLDEPFTALDLASRDALLDAMAGPLRSSARSVVLVVHDRAEAWALADRVVVMLGGQILADGPPAQLLTAPPTPAVARFLGFTGEVRAGQDLILTRPGHVVIDPNGGYIGAVTRAVNQEDGVKVDVSCGEGILQLVVPSPGPPVGSILRLALVGGVRFTPCATP